MNDPKRFQDLEEYERWVAKEAGSSTAIRTDRAKVYAALGRLEEDGFIILENLLSPAFVERAIAVEMPAGSIVFFLGTLWHGGGANSADHARLCLIAHHCEPWCRTVENYSLSMPKSLVKQCSAAIQTMLGYSIHSALMGYVDGRHPKHLLGTRC